MLVIHTKLRFITDIFLFFIRFYIFLMNFRTVAVLRAVVSSGGEGGGIFPERPTLCFYRLFPAGGGGMSSAVEGATHLPQPPPGGRTCVHISVRMYYTRAYILAKYQRLRGVSACIRACVPSTGVTPPPLSSAPVRLLPFLLLWA